MVPVPEELAPKVLRYISWRDNPLLRELGTAKGDDEPPPDGAPADDVGGVGGVGDREADPVARVFARLDGQSRTLLAVAATAELGREELTVTEAARRAGLSERELIGITTEVNNLVAGEGGPMTVLVKGRDGAEDEPFAWDRRVVVMPQAVARSIADLTGASAGS